MDNFGLQLYTIRGELSGDEAARAMKRVKELGYSYVQVAGSLAAIERTGLMAREIGLEVIGSVGFIEYILADFDEAVRVHKAIGARDVGVSADFRSASEVREYILKANALADRLGEVGLSLSYHNHAKEFEDLGGINAMDILLEESEDINFILDTYWVRRGGADTLDMIKRIGAGRMKNLHLKDLSVEPDGPECPIGLGVIDFKPIVALRDELGIPNALVEQDNAALSEDSYGQMKISYDNIHHLFEE